MRKIWLDDMREAPEGYQWVKNYNEAVKAFESGPVDIASLDHDLFDYPYGGNNYYGVSTTKSGCDFVQWLVENPQHWPRVSVAMHTDYPAGRKNMMDLIETYGPYDYRDYYEIYYGPYNSRTWGYIYTKEEDFNGSEEESRKIGKIFGEKEPEARSDSACRYALRKAFGWLQGYEVRRKVQLRGL